MDEGTRRCLWCRTTLPLEDFDTRRGSTQLDNFCRACRKKTEAKPVTEGSHKRQ